MRVIHLPTTTGGNPQGISKHLNQLGVKSTTWTLYQNFFGYPADKVLLSVKNGEIFNIFLKSKFLFYPFKFDVVFFNSGTGLFTPFIPSRNDNNSKFKNFIYYFLCMFNTIMSSIEIWLLSMTKTPLFIQYQGDDARQGDYCLKNFPISIADKVDKNYYSPESDEVKRKSIRFYDRVAYKIYALNPDLLHVLPARAEFLPYSHVNMDEWLPVFNQLENRPLRIGHAPSHRAVKGTDHIVAVCDKLSKEGFEFELVLIEGVSNNEAKELYKTLDILVDQLYAGWYGGLAVEVMALGKPVLSYIREADLHFIPMPMRNDIPIINVEMVTLYEKLKEILLLPREDLIEIAQRSRTYVEKWHNPIAIAERIKIDMEESLQ